MLDYRRVSRNRALIYLMGGGHWEAPFAIPIEPWRIAWERWLVWTCEFHGIIRLKHNSVWKKTLHQLFWKTSHYKALIISFLAKKFFHQQWRSNGNKVPKASNKSRWHIDPSKAIKHETRGKPSRLNTDKTDTKFLAKFSGTTHRFVSGWNCYLYHRYYKLAAVSVQLAFATFDSL